MAEAPQSEAARRAAARKAKILARGNTGLNKLAQTARGDEAGTLYGDASTPSSARPAPTSSTPSVSGSIPPPTSRSQPTSQPRPQSGIPADQQAMNAQLEAMMSMFGGPGSQSGMGGGEMPDMGRLLAQMMGDSSLAGGLPSQNLLGDVDDPAGLGGAGPGEILPNFFGGGAGADGMPPFPFPGMSGMGGPSTRKTKVEKWFPLVHWAAVALLALFAVVWWEPALRAVAPFKDENERWAGRWEGFAGRSGWKVRGAGEVEVLPIFWAFTSLELILQTTRVLLFKSPARPHSMIQNLLPLMPPSISQPVLTASQYLSLFSQTYKDGCLLVFLIGMTVVLAETLQGVV
ncbi:hypothetical protein IAT38_006111 [Cryptococcus sp. DSM 104549]